MKLEFAEVELLVEDGGTMISRTFQRHVIGSSERRKRFGLGEPQHEQEKSWPHGPHGAERG